MSKRRRAKARAKEFGASMLGGKIGGRSIANTVVGALIYNLEQKIVPDFAGDFQDGVDMFIVSLLPGQKDFRTVGLKKIISVGMEKYIFPRLGGLGGLIPAQISLGSKNGLQYNVNLKAV